MNQKIKDDANVAAVYFVTLVTQGVPAESAVQLTASYIAGRMIEEWEK